MSTKNCKQTLSQTLKKEGSIKDGLPNFQKFLRGKDGNDDDDTEIGSFERRLLFTLDLQNGAAKEELAKKYFKKDGLSLNNGSLRKELSDFEKLDKKSLEEKITSADDDVKQVRKEKLNYVLKNCQHFIH